LQRSSTGAKDELTMLDGVVRRWIDPALDRAGQKLAARHVDADHLTLAGLCAGLVCAAAVVARWDATALVLLALGRVLDGLDGAVARAGRPTDRGGYLDIVCDFIFYGALPLAFAIRDPAVNALPAAVLLAAFYANGASFLAFSAIAAKRGMGEGMRGPKTLYYTTGLAEGTETIAVFVAMILLPAWFGIIAYGFAAICAVTCMSRILLAWRLFGAEELGK
jgi:phosphatidylglycerophosphate synthase